MDKTRFVVMQPFIRCTPDAHWEARTDTDSGADTH